MPGEGERDVARAATKIKGALVRSCFAQLNQPALPITVQTKTLKVIDQIVPPGDGVEKIVYPGGALSSRLIIPIGHAPNRVTQGASAGDADPKKTARNDNIKPPILYLDGAFVQRVFKNGGSGGARTRLQTRVFLRKNARRPKPVNAIL